MGLPHTSDRRAQTMLRNLLFYPALFLATGFFALVAVSLGRLDRSGRVASWAGRWWSRVLLWAAGVRIDADTDAIPDDENVIVMANHQSQLDILILYHLLRKRQVGFVAKKSLFTIPLFGPAMRAAGHIPIDRENRRKAMQSIDDAVEEARRGRTIIIFPEGTRSLDYSGLDQFKIGGMIMALKCRIPVVPVVLSGSGPLLPKGKVLLQGAPRTVKVRALAPIAPDRYSLKQREDFKQELHERMSEAYTELAA
jgi:1-acyl-sn-glycerol-3-phosphate acyltransferase